MKYVENVADYYRDLIDEADITFVTGSNASVYLAQGYSQFRRFVTSLDPTFYRYRAGLTVSGRSYDLSAGAVSVMGATPTDPRLDSIVLMESVENATTWNTLATFMPVASHEEMHISPGTFSYVLEGSNLLFSSDVSLVRMTYQGVPDVDWTRTTVGDNEWIDDLVDYHDLIALYAARPYAIRDGEIDQSIEFVIAQREKALSAVLSGSRNAALRSVANVYRGDRWNG